ncbi:MAG: hypothetical protein KTR29_01355 [Rhodothermaceae bacterium]|nr:hypothetical protein [Rhodothermaceae bacterium]
MYSAPPTVLERIDMLGIPDVVLFGIKSGVKLAKQGRLSFVESTISKSLVLPLPNFDATFSKSSAHLFFKTADGQAHLEESTKLKELFDRHRNLSDEEEAFYISAAKDFRLLKDI